ncbi:MAG: bifunctional hydroxymethylpyrimidine kinase/phosphomethylpyrimidine kinase [Blastocatellia bacterium]|nr:MAG: bifunctional hydroxymethylpyrimidine kinase/phosphomethylpyrimidine kinase [Blastocatellia bacterium]
MNKNRPVVLSIAGLDPSGGAGIVADIRTIAAFGCFPAAAITSITYQNTTGVFGAVHQTADVLLSQIQPIIDDSEIASVKTGMLPSAEIVDAVARLVSTQKLPMPIVDPVMVSTSGHDLIDAEALSILKGRLLQQARLVTPNIPEAERLTGQAIRNEADMRNAAQRIRELGPRAVLVKGGHGGPRNAEKGLDEAIDVLLDEEENFHVFRAEYFEVGEVHGSGCTLSAAIAACLALGMSLQSAVGEAKQFVSEAIRSSEPTGQGARTLFGVR